MRYEDVFVAGAAGWLPAAVPVAAAVAAGLCDEVTARLSGMVSVTVADADSGAPAEMAARAARLALRRSGVAPADVVLLLHASLYHQAHDLWAPASYVQRTAVGNSCPAMEVRQVSNGGMAALELAVAYLAAAPGRTAAVLTAADRFALPGFDRWRSDPGTVYADGGAALVVSTRGGFARLRSLVLGSDPELEGMHREGEAFGAAGTDGDGRGPRPVDLEACKRGFLAQVGSAYAASRVRAGQRRVLSAVLDEAGVGLGDIDRFVLPHFGRRRLESSFVRLLDLDLERTTWDWSRRVGHLGAGDQFAGLAHLVEGGALRPGDRCLLLGVGSGFSWSGAVLEILDRPGRRPGDRDGREHHQPGPGPDEFPVARAGGSSG